jgi:hypothetical protein
MTVLAIVAPPLIIPCIVAIVLLIAALGALAIEVLSSNGDGRALSSESLGIAAVVECFSTTLGAVFWLLLTVVLPSQVLRHLFGEACWLAVMPILTILFSVVCLACLDAGSIVPDCSTDLLARLWRGRVLLLAHGISLTVLMGGMYAAVRYAYSIHLSLAVLLIWPFLVTVALVWAVQLGTLLQAGNRSAEI